MYKRSQQLRMDLRIEFIGLGSMEKEVIRIYQTLYYVKTFLKNLNILKEDERLVEYSMVITRDGYNNFLCYYNYKPFGRFLSLTY